MKKKLILSSVLCLMIFFLLSGYVTAATPSYTKIDSGTSKSVYHEDFSVTFKCKYSYLGTKKFLLTYYNKFSWNTYQSRYNKNHLAVKGVESRISTIKIPRGVPSNIATQFKRNGTHFQKITHYIYLGKVGNYLIVSEIVSGKKMPQIRVKTSLSTLKYYWVIIHNNFRHWYG